MISTLELALPRPSKLDTLSGIDVLESLIFFHHRMVCWMPLKEQPSARSLRVQCPTMWHLLKEARFLLERHGRNASLRTNRTGRQLKEQKTTRKTRTKNQSTISTITTTINRKLPFVRMPTLVSRHTTSLSSHETSALAPRLFCGTEILSWETSNTLIQRKVGLFFFFFSPQTYPHNRSGDSMRIFSRPSPRRHPSD